MSDKKPEDLESIEFNPGFTAIPNDLFELILKYPFTKRQQTIVLALVRKIYGFIDKKTGRRKTKDDISLSQLANMTGLKRPHISPTLKELEALNVITRKPGRYGQILSINGDLKTWGVTKTVTPNAASVTETVTDDECYQNSNTGVTKTVTEVLPIQELQKKTSKENLKRKPKENKKEKTTAPAKKRKRAVAHEIPENFYPNDSTLQYLRTVSQSVHQSISEEQFQQILKPVIANFIAYWSDRKAKRKSWDLTLRNNPVADDALKKATYNLKKQGGNYYDNPNNPQNQRTLKPTGKGSAFDQVVAANYETIFGTGGKNH